MKKFIPAYQIVSKSTALLLLMAFLIPTGLHARQLVDFCMMEMNSHEMIATMQSSTHGHCDPEPVVESESDHEDCDWGFICACNIGQSQLADEDWIPTKNNLEITLTQQGKIASFFTSNKHISADQKIRIGQYDPPLWLLYDTLLL